MNMATRVGELSLPSFVLTAAGTSGHGDELSGYGDLSELGAVVTKSLAAFEWAGNRAPRVAASRLSARSSGAACACGRVHLGQECQ
jgi:dihydroorotate dehydrogenase